MKILITAIFGILILVPYNSSWEKLTVDSDLTPRIIDSTDWVYPWWVIKHQDGHFENTFGEPITQEDTTHLIRNSKCMVTYNSGEKTVSYRIPFADAVQKGDTIIINLYDQSASNYETLNIHIVENKFQIEYYKAYIPGLLSWEVAYDEQELTLNQMPKMGKNIKGKLKIEINEVIEWNKDYSQESDTLNKKIEGFFEVMIK